MYASLMPDLIGIQEGPAASVKIASRAGFAGIDLRINRFVDEVERIGVEALRDAIAAAGLRPGYCSATAQKISVPEEDWRAEMLDLPRRARVASALGFQRATSVVLPFSDDLEPNANTDLHVARVREAADLLAEHGISFGLEYVSPRTRWEGKPHPFVRTLSGMLELLDAVDRPTVGVMLDCFHWHCAGEGADDLRTLAPERIVAVHVNDLIAGRPVEEQTVVERALPGETGLVDIAVFLRTLAEIGYAGPITSEPTNPRWQGAEPDAAALETREAIDGCMREAGVLAEAGSRGGANT